MNEINKIGPTGMDPKKGAVAKKPQPNEVEKFRELLKSAEAFSAEVDRTVEGAQSASMDTQVTQIGKTLESLEGIVKQLEPAKGEHHGPTAKQAADKYGKMDLKKS
ncbi:MAG: hypothetical protein RRB13_07755 [bacterium]|nr:hypothetical protein [bacterium]